MKLSASAAEQCVTLARCGLRTAECAFNEACCTLEEAQKEVQGLLVILHLAELWRGIPKGNPAASLRSLLAVLTDFALVACPEDVNGGGGILGISILNVSQFQLVVLTADCNLMGLGGLHTRGAQGDVEALEVIPDHVWLHPPQEGELRLVADRELHVDASIWPPQASAHVHLPTQAHLHLPVCAQQAPLHHSCWVVVLCGGHCLSEVHAHAHAAVNAVGVLSEGAP